MSRRSLVDYWNSQNRSTSGWCHPEDAPFLEEYPHSFNLDFPVSPYIGDVLNAHILILGANAGYKPETTPSEFPDTDAIEAYLSKVASPSDADWSTAHEYYESVNYGDLIKKGQAALINCCAYRSPSISKEKDNQNLIKQLPSCTFARQWLENSIVPLAQQRQLLVVANRHGLWSIKHLREISGIIFDPAPVSPHLSNQVLNQVEDFLN